MTATPPPRLEVLGQLKKLQCTGESSDKGLRSVAPSHNTIYRCVHNVDVYIQCIMWIDN